MLNTKMLQLLSRGSCFFAPEMARIFIFCAPKRQLSIESLCADIGSNILLFRKSQIFATYRGRVVLCLIGGYLLTNFYDATVRFGDGLVLLGALFWSTHIIFTGMIVTKYNLPLTIGALQTLIVAIFSLC